MNATKVICIYHKNCYDGLAAAWVVRKFYMERFNIIPTFIPMNYGENIPELDCEQLVLVDFSFKRDIMLKLKEKMSLLVLDHHKTAQADCDSLDFCHFDMNESGASLAWKYFFPREVTPRFIEYVKDRDLWTNKLPSSKEVVAYIQSFQFEFHVYDNLQFELERDLYFQQIVNQGASILRYKDTLVKSICRNYVIQEIAGYKAAIVNSPILMSEIGHELAQVPGVDFGAYYFDRPDGKTQWGARSIGDFDVSEIAKTFGGGGHKNAAGWEVEK